MNTHHFLLTVYILLLSMHGRLLAAVLYNDAPLSISAHLPFQWHHTGNLILATVVSVVSIYIIETGVCYKS